MKLGTSHEPRMEEPALLMKLSTSSPRPSPPSAMEERVAKGQERRRLVVQGFMVQGFNARIVRGMVSPRKQLLGGF